MKRQKKNYNLCDYFLVAHELFLLIQYKDDRNQTVEVLWEILTAAS